MWTFENLSSFVIKIFYMYTFHYLLHCERRVRVRVYACPNADQELARLDLPLSARAPDLQLLVADGHAHVHALSRTACSSA
jgi:hypothetical protein